MRARLRSLAHVSLYPLADGPAVASWGFAYRLEEQSKARVDRHAYLGRYWGIPPSEIERMPTKLVREYQRAISDIIRAENGEKPKGRELP